MRIQSGTKAASLPRCNDEGALGQGDMGWRSLEGMRSKRRRALRRKLRIRRTNVLGAVQINQRFENILPNAVGGEANASTLGQLGAYSGERVE